MIDGLAIATLIAWALLGGAIVGGGGTTKGFHVVVPVVLSVALAVVVLAGG